jgi:hypothetical protein
MAEQLLNGSQVGSAVEQMGRGRMPESVRTDIRQARDSPGPVVYYAPNGPLVDAPTAGTEQQR